MCDSRENSIFVSIESKSDGALKTEMNGRNRQMAMTPVKIPPSMKGPAIYRIRVEGRLEAMNITELQCPDGGVP